MTTGMDRYGRPVDAHMFIVKKYWKKKLKYGYHISYTS
jgi:hypothetical protein